MSAPSLGWCFDPRLHIALLLVAFLELVAFDPADSAWGDADDCVFNRAHVVNIQGDKADLAAWAARATRD